jgi:hypothetical protein
MRLSLLLTLTACSQSGLLLEVHGTKDAPIAKVEVFVPDAMHESGMGMPPKQSPKTPGTVWAVIATASAEASGNAATILLQPGEIDQVPALLVVGEDANHDAVSYALITDPNGPIALPHAKSNEIVVDLEPTSEVTVDDARKMAPATRIARWSAQTVDDNTGPCIAVIHPDGTGDFFGPADDKDCDAATPECDDTWFLHSAGAGKCATQLASALDNTQDACRLGNTLGCTDNVTKNGTCTAQDPAICAPVTLCEQCQGVIDDSCVASAVNDNRTMSMQCVAYVNMESGTPLWCPGREVIVSMQPEFGDPYACNGVSGFAGFLNNTPLGTLQMQSTMNSISFACHGGTTDFDFIASGNSDAVDPQMLPTSGTIVFGVNAGTTSSTRLLAMPFVVSYQPVAPCPPDGFLCSFFPGDENGGPFDDPMWHCAGR